uniref:Protein quiver n=1 Tax=Anopheles dirus TaxID=7168 RepID=A0A182NRM1_9DIPT
MHAPTVTQRVVPARGRRVNMAAVLKHISGNTLAQQVLVPITLLLLMAVIPFQMVHGIDCFKCVSMNGANKACDDPFHNNYSAAILESPCMGGRKGRDGLFPATSCIKIAGYYDDTGETITVRGCALDSGTLTTDTEIIRMSHCGRFYYDDRYVHGCLQSCNDADACNGAPRGSSTPWLILLAVIGSLLGSSSSSSSATLQPSRWFEPVNDS